MADLWSFRGVVMLTDDEDDPIALDLIEGLGVVSVRGSDWVAPKRPGRIQRPRYKDTRIIPVKGHVKGGGWTAWKTATDSVVAAFDRSLTPGAVIINPPYLGVTEAITIMARCTSIMPGDIQNGAPLQRWTFELEAIDPDWEPVESS